MIQERVINNTIVKPVKLIAVERENIKGSSMFPELYYNTFISAKRNSGKTSVLSQILLNTCDKKTTLFIFCPTWRVDTVWSHIIESLENKGCEVNLYDSIVEGKVNILDDIINCLCNENEDPKKTAIENPIEKLMFKETKERKEYKPKRRAPRYFFVMDDCHQLKNPSVERLSKMNRHIKCNILLSSQYIHDVRPLIIKNLSHFLCFRSFSRDKLEHIHKILDLSVTLEKFFEIYDYVFKNPDEKYNFLYIDVRNNLFRKNFNKQIVLEDE
jgi:hypothetical protein